MSPTSAKGSHPNWETCTFITKPDPHDEALTTIHGAKQSCHANIRDSLQVQIAVVFWVGQPRSQTIYALLDASAYKQNLSVLPAHPITPTSFTSSPPSIHKAVTIQLLLLPYKALYCVALNPFSIHKVVIVQLFLLSDEAFDCALIIQVAWPELHAFMKGQRNVHKSCHNVWRSRVGLSFVAVVLGKEASDLR
eukprot:1144128-Pelagomonas_calceolata.AAC.2